MSYRPIADYAIIGDCRSAALVSRDGSIDWLCFPRFDSPSVFAAILDSGDGGCFRVAPAVEARVTRRYIGESNVLETTFEVPTGVMVLTDAMPVADEAAKTASLWPDHEVLRRIECTEGQVEVTVRYEPRPTTAPAVPSCAAARIRPFSASTAPNCSSSAATFLCPSAPAAAAHPADGCSGAASRRLSA